MLGIAALEKLVHELSRFPGVGSKTAQRFAYHLLRAPAADSFRLIEALQLVREQVHLCPQCFNYTDQDSCRYCRDPHRSEEVLCLVEEPSDIMRIESSGVFRGRYHVLHGVLSPLEGIGPEDLKIAELLQRLQLHPEIRELILCLDADIEGDTTVLYLAKQLFGRNLKLTRIAHGVPIGGDIEYVDERTMGRALENRIQIE